MSGYTAKPAKFIGRQPPVPPHEPTENQVRAYLTNRDRDPDDPAQRRAARRELAKLEAARMDHVNGLPNRTYTSPRKSSRGGSLAERA